MALWLPVVIIEIYSNYNIKHLSYEDVQTLIHSPTIRERARHSCLSPGSVRPSYTLLHVQESYVELALHVVPWRNATFV